MTSDQRAEAQRKAAAASKLAKDPAKLMEAMGLQQSGEDRRRIFNRLVDMPKTMRRLFCRAYLGRSMRAAVKAHCLMCVGYDRKEVSLCSSPECPLYPYRPVF